MPRGVIHRAGEPHDLVQLCADCGCKLNNYVNAAVMLNEDGSTPPLVWWQPGALVGQDGGMFWVVESWLSEGLPRCSETLH